MIRELITDSEELSYRSGEIDVRKEGTDLRAAVVDLKDTIRDHKLLALAGVQVGIPRRFFVINYSGKLRSYVNPMITKVDGFTISRETDPCIPDKTFLVPRYNKIELNYMTPMGEIQATNLVGKAAYVAQQMCDYMEGVMISDIGLEINKEFDNASDEEKAEVLRAFIETLEVREKELKEDIAEDPILNKLDENIRFETAKRNGEIEVTGDVEIPVMPAAETEDE